MKGASTIRSLGSALAIACSTWSAAHAVELHVSIGGDDRNPGTRGSPLRTIQRAADMAQPGDTITVHAGLYRERVNPPRGGDSDARRIVYRAAPGERVEIRGSEIVKGWERVQGDVWKAIVPNSLFGSFNPFADRIHGDWFDPLGREHHTGAVYLDGVWLTEASSLESLMAGNDANAPTSGSGQVLLNVAWLRTGSASQRRPATSYVEQRGVQNAPCEEGGDCIGWIERGDWVRYEAFDFGTRAREVELRVASATSGGLIELRLDNPTGPLIGTASVPHTGGWQDWVSVKARIRPTSGVRSLVLAFRDATEAERAPGLWYAKVGPSTTTIWARFPNVDPTRRTVEINVRQTVFYPDRPGRNYITVRGFIMRHAATPWAPPTAEQIGLIGTHWSKGWIIENCTISHSVCSGISLGKHGDEYDNTSANTAEGYVKTIERGLARGWNRDTIGGHIVRNNTISHCEQAGIVGSLGAAFCVVTGNTIHDIHMRRLFTGAEMAGIKFHGAIDTVISDNHIYRTCLGLWLDWMAQGTRVTRNVFHHNLTHDLFVEVNHGPFLVDNNLFLSPGSLLDVSQGGAYAHNLFLGRITTFPDLGRQTPYHPAHETRIAGFASVRGGDDRFVNNLFVGGRGRGLWVYDKAGYPLKAAGNAYLGGARPHAGEADPFIRADHRSDPRIVARGTGVRLELTIPGDMPGLPLVTTATLGRARVTDLPYESADGSPIVLDRDFLGRSRSAARVIPGPFATLKHGRNAVRLR